MAWTSVKEHYRDRTAQDYQGGKTATRVYICVNSDIVTDITDCWTADDGSVAIPIKGASWPGIAAMRVRRIRVRLIGKSRKVFDVHVIYDTKATAYADPTNIDWEIGWGTQTRERAIHETIIDVSSLTGGFVIGAGSGAAIQNTAEDRFDPPIKEKKYLDLVTLVKNKSSSTISTLNAYKGKINSVQITIAGQVCAIWTALIVDINVQKVLDDDGDYYKETYKVLYDVDTHIRQLLNVGFNQLDVGSDPTSKVRIYLDTDGNDTEDPQKLDAAGQMTDSTYFIYFGTLDQVAFAGLSLPTTF